ncbi:MAG TPA: glycine cleavage system protein GcvH [Candidatus Omnitrophota bacterium]|nr:glycine cleavage system protein GcvH [Candidatus Omnitrophota bacterium]HPS19424.1 glycine cleavage system protein GcvH [Candidatus Omnitrophota bacterium]
MVPANLKYSKEHEWVKIEGQEAVMGITDHAQSALGDITFIDLPKKGRDVKSGDSISTVESVKAASDIYAPVTGKITSVNDALNGAPEIINKSPYGDGWICKISVQSVDMSHLMDAAAYESYLKGLK